MNQHDNQLSQVLSLVIRGYNVQQMAQELNIKEETITEDLVVIRDMIAKPHNFH